MPSKFIVYTALCQHLYVTDRPYSLCVILVVHLKPVAGSVSVCVFVCALTLI